MSEHGFIDGPRACLVCWAQVHPAHIDAHDRWHRQSELRPESVLAALRELYRTADAADPLGTDEATR